MISWEVPHGCQGRTMGEGITGSCSLFFKSGLEPVCTKLEGVFGLDTLSVASEVCHERIEGRH